MTTHYGIKNIPNDTVFLYADDAFDLPSVLPPGLVRLNGGNVREFNGSFPSGLESIFLDSIKVCPDNLPEHVENLFMSTIRTILHLRLNENGDRDSKLKHLTRLKQLSIDNVQHPLHIKEMLGDASHLIHLSAMSCLSLDGLPDNLRQLIIGEHTRLHCDMPRDLNYLVVGAKALRARDDIEKFWHKNQNMANDDVNMELTHSMK